MTKIIQDVNLGVGLRRCRIAKGLSQTDLCARMDTLGRPMLTSTYSQIENGKRNIFLSDLIAIKTILDVSYDELFQGLEYLPREHNEDE